MPSLRTRCTATMGALRLDVQFETTRPWTVLFGPSGSGKSSVLRCIAGVWRPAGCDVALDGKPVSKLSVHRRRIAMVAQQPALFPHMTVMENILFALRTGGIASSSAELRHKAASLLEQFRIGHTTAQRPRELSGGETKRAALVRAVASDPHFLLLDEVFTGLDDALSNTLRSELRRWQQQRGTPILSVTHDLHEALDADDLLRLENGRVTAQGTPAEVLHAERSAMAARLTSAH